MNKIVLFEPSIASINIGDQIIVDSIKNIFNDITKDSFIVEISTHLPLTSRYAKYLGSFQYKLICGSNLIVGNFGSIIHLNQWPVSIFNYKNYSPCILIGAGAQKYNMKINSYSRFIYHSILHKDFLHSVRDSYTKMLLEKAGFTNIVNTGCPTMWGLTPNHCKKIPVNKGESVIFTLTDYEKIDNNEKRNRDNKLINTLIQEYDKVFFWPQGIKDWEYYKSLDASKEIKILNPNLASLDEVLSKPGVDYIGTRLHAGIRALQFKKRTIIIAIDNRAKEINADFSIPIIDKKDIDNLSNVINQDLKTNIILPVENIRTFLKQFNINYDEIIGEK